MTSEIRLVGPIFPLTGGIAQHTARLGFELERAGHKVTVESWSHQYPRALYPGSSPKLSEPEVPMPTNVKRELKWYSPISWWLAGRRARKESLLVLTVTTAFHAIPSLVTILGARKGPKSMAIAHNAVPHETTPFDRLLLKLFFRRCDLVLTHDHQSGRIITREYSVEPNQIVTKQLPSPWLRGAQSESEPTRLHTPRLLFFGAIRPYKGLDILLDAMALVEEPVTLTVFGDFWQKSGNYRKQADSLGLGARVDFKEGYVKSRDFSKVFSSGDVLVMPYRSGTSSIVPALAMDYGIPVIATDVGSIAQLIEHDVNGLVVASATVHHLAKAINKACVIENLERWRRGVQQQRVSSNEMWKSYCEVFS